MKRIVIPTQFYAMLHDPGNGRYATSTVTLNLTAKAKMITLPDGILYNPYGGGIAPIYPEPFTADFLFKGSTPNVAQTMYDDVAQYLGFTATLFGTDAGDTPVTIQALMTKIVRTDKWKNQESKTIKFQLTFQPMTNDWV